MNPIIGIRGDIFIHEMLPTALVCHIYIMMYIIYIMMYIYFFHMRLFKKMQELWPERPDQKSVARVTSISTDVVPLVKEIHHTS